ncbi:unnamed protein product [Prorocentrum cordatum]|uniref:Uncharacterized protein n=1 Tax=Prorocentrum cordatum TaxID=2364126 RepID=A0ABN9V3W8_9DINO|nr:unnamed protein product [Polarella glacialis]
MARPRGSVHPPATRRAAGGRGDGRGQADRVPCFFFWGGEWTAGARAEERPACPQGALGLLVGLEGVAMDSVAPAPKTHGRPGVSGLGFLRKASCGRAPHRNRPPASTDAARGDHAAPLSVRSRRCPRRPWPRAPACSPRRSPGRPAQQQQQQRFEPRGATSPRAGCHRRRPPRRARDHPQRPVCAHGFPPRVAQGKEIPVLSRIARSSPPGIGARRFATSSKACLGSKCTCFDNRYGMCGIPPLQA